MDDKDCNLCEADIDSCQACNPVDKNVYVERHCATCAGWNNPLNYSGCIDCIAFNHWIKKV